MAKVSKLSKALGKLKAKGGTVVPGGTTPTFNGPKPTGGAAMGGTKPIGSTGIFAKGGSAENQTWRFLYTTLSDIRKAVNKKNSLKESHRGTTKYIITEGASYAEAYDKAKREGEFKEKQLLGARQLTEKEISALNPKAKGGTVVPGSSTPTFNGPKPTGGAAMGGVKAPKAFADGGVTASDDYDAIIEKINAIIEKNLPGFWYQVRPYEILGSRRISIKIAAMDHEINRVNFQYPQMVSLALDPKTWTLNIQVFGGWGGDRVYRDVNKDDPKEKFLAMKGVKVPFRTPLHNETAVMKAIERFTLAYKKVLQDNIDVLRYRDIVNYKELLTMKAKGGTVVPGSTTPTFNGPKPTGGAAMGGTKPIGSTGLFARGGRPGNTAQEAKNMTVFVIENGEVEKTNLFDHVMTSATEVTSPRGIWNQIFVEEVEILEDGMEEPVIKWGLKDWGRNAHNRTPKTVELFDTEEEADNECFRLHEAYDFANDDQRDTQYWSTEAEAIAELESRNADEFKNGGAVNNAPLPNEFAHESVNENPKNIVPVIIPNSQANAYAENRIPFKGTNMEGRELDNGDFIVLAWGYYLTWWYDASQGKWYGNSDNYSKTTSLMQSQSRPSWEVEMLPLYDLLPKMQEANAKFELGGVMIRTLNPMTTDNTLGAHAGSALSSQDVV